MMCQAKFFIKNEYIFDFDSLFNFLIMSSQDLATKDVNHFIFNTIIDGRKVIKRMDYVERCLSKRM